MIPKLEQIKTLLREQWDPIVMMPHLPADEYDSFAFQVFSRFQSGATVSDITQYLAWAAAEQIGVETVPEREQAVAGKAASIMDV